MKNDVKSNFPKNKNNTAASFSYNFPNPFTDILKRNIINIDDRD